jgi:hypothetical protein
MVFVISGDARRPLLDLQPQTRICARLSRCSLHGDVVLRRVDRVEQFTAHQRER